MKRILFLIFLIGFSIQSNAQATKDPVVDKTKVKGANIFGVKLTPESTSIAIGLDGLITMYDWIVVRPKTYIEYINPATDSIETKQVIYMTDIKGNSLSFNTKYYMLPSRAIVLNFPSIPKEVSKINLIEKGGWKWYGINITARNDVDVKRIATTEEDINKLIASSNNSNAGTYESLIPSESMPNYRLALIQTDEGIFLIYIGCLDSESIGSWKCGEVKAILRPTVSNSIYKADWFMVDKTVSSALVTFDGATMKLRIGDNNSDDVFVKMSKGDQTNEANLYSEKWTGTGFALKGGYILTNYHVVEEAKDINIYGIDGDFNNGVKACVVGSDKSNDLALLKIVGNVPTSFNLIPYGFKSNIADVGENVYVLGYPLTATMGEEVKLTNGIISAKTGFEGDVSQYQISAPIQPGNSGGPLIDYNGDVIGVICAKHRGTENVSYAVKNSQVKNLIESVSDLDIINTENSLLGKSIKEQVKLVHKYVYIIKCSK